MSKYTVIAGLNGTGKSSLRGILEGEACFLGKIIDADFIAKANNFNTLKAGKQALSEIKACLDMNISFTQETTLAGKSIKQNMIKARAQGYFISMYYVGLSSCEESLARIQNRVKKGGHNIPFDDVVRRYSRRIDSLKQVVDYCDEVTFYDNENGFIAVAKIRNGKFSFIDNYRPIWLVELADALHYLC